MEKKINKDGVIETIVSKSPFGCFKNFKPYAEKDFDQYYFEKHVKQVVKVTGTGEDDFVLENKEIINKISIKDSINAQAGEAGMDAYLKPYLSTGESLPDVKVTDQINDYTNAPETLADAIHLGEDAKKKFAKLDPKLTKGMSAEEFLTSFTQKAFDEWLTSLGAKEDPKTKEGE